MINKILNLTLLFGLIAFAGCKDDDGHVASDPDYHILIESPDGADKQVGDVIEVRVEFEDHNEGTVHHVNVRLYNKATGVELFSEPTQAHVHESSGIYEFVKEVTLDVDPDTDLVLEAKVWGHDAGVAEVVESLEFHVNP